MPGDTAKALATQSEGERFIAVTSSLNSIVKTIEDSSSARIKLILRGGTEQRLDCIYKEDIAPHFYLVFKPGELPDNIDLHSTHPVTIRQKNSILSLNTTILEKKGDRTLRFTAKGIVDPASLREYFRVNTTTEISVSHSSRDKEGARNSWEIGGVTQDISASGVLAMLDSEPKNRDDLVIELYLPNNRRSIHAVGHVVRKKLLRNRKWQVSFHFDSISSKHRDAIITYLLSVQRKQLRENVQTYDY